MYKKLLLLFLTIMCFQYSFSQNYVEIGNGTMSTSLPFYSSWNYSWTSSIYPATTLGGEKTITAIALDVISGNKTMTDQKIFMKNTDLDVFADASYENPTSNGYTLVYEGSITFEMGWSKITLDTPFDYNGSDNLAIHIENSWGQSYGPSFNSTSSEINNNKSAGSDQSFPTTNGYLNAYPSTLTNMRFFYDSGDAPVTPSNPIPELNSIKNTLETDIKFTLGNNTTNYDLYFGMDKSALTKVVDNEVVSAPGEFTYSPAAMLEAKTVYYWQVIAKNATASESSPVWSFETQGAITEFPYVTGFEEKWEGVGQWWSSIINTNYEDSTDWVWDEGWNYTTEPNVYEDSTSIFCSVTKDGEYSVQTPRIILPENYRASFWYRNGSMQSKVSGQDTTFFEVTTDGGTNWTTLDTISADAAMSEWGNSIVDLIGYEGNNVYLRWRYKRSDGGYNIYIDNFEIFALPSGPQIELWEEEIEYRKIAKNGSTKVEVVIKNTGVDDMNVTSVSVEAPFNCDFSGTIAPNKQDTLDIYFSPTEVGTFNATLTVNSNATNENANTIELTGTGTSLVTEFYETFDVSKEMPEGWSHIDSPYGYISGGGSQISSGDYDAYSAPNALKMLVSNDTVNAVVVLTPGLEGYTDNKFTFKAKKWDSIRDLDLQVGTMSDPYDASTFVARSTVSLTSDFETYEVTFKPDTKAPYIAFKHGLNPTGASDWTSLRIDDVSWEEIPDPNAVPDPAILGEPADNATEIDIMNNPFLTWLPGSSNTDGYNVYIGTSETTWDVVNGQEVGKNPTIFEVTQDLDYNTKYYWKIIPFNASGSCEEENEVRTFVTMSNPTVTVPWSENFDEVVAQEGTYERPVGWSTENPHDDLTWDLLVDNASMATFSHSAPNSMHVGFGMNPKDDYLYTPPVAMSKDDTYQLTFWMHTDVDMVTGSLYKEKLKVYYGIDNKSSEMKTLLVDTVIDVEEYREVKVSFSPEADGDYFIGFHAWSDPMQYLLIIDDVSMVKLNPSFTSEPILTAKVGEQYQYNISTKNPSEETLTISATTKPNWLSFTDNEDGTAVIMGTPSESGNYDVVLEASNDSYSITQSYTITVDATNGIGDLEGLSGISIAPNPAKSNVNITVQDNFTVPYQIQLINLTGKKVYENFIDENQFTLNLESFDSGLYFVVVFDGNKKYTHKLIIK